MIDDPAIKTPHLQHQAETYSAHSDDPFYALFWEMGLGKTKTIVDVLSHLYLSKKIDGVIILAPNSVYYNWINQEMPAHMAVPYVKILFKSGSKGDKARMRRALFLNPEEWIGKLRVICMSYDGLKTEHGYKLLRDFSLLYRCAIVADESTSLKNGSTATAKYAKQIRSNCHFAWIATGTPIAQSPFDIHSQIEFLCPDFWKNHGMKSVSAFKNQFGVFEQRRAGMRVFSTCVGYRNIDKLQELIQPISSRLLKEDSTVKLPPKMYKTISFELSQAQRRAYDQLRKEFLTELEDNMAVEAPLAIVRLTRLQQIASGFVSAESIPVKPLDTESQLELIEDSDDSAYESLPADTTWAAPMVDIPIVNIPIVNTPIEEIKPRVIEKRMVDIVAPSENPRLKILLDIVERCSHKLIVWCKFKRDVQIISQALAEQCVVYDGAVDHAQREINIARFKDANDNVKVLVANIHSISQGVTLIIAKTVVYYTNSFSPEKRLQSEDRPHRIGQDTSVLIIDLVAEDTVDERLIEGLRKKYDISAKVMGDRFREWIQPISRDEGESTDE